MKENWWHDRERTGIKPGLDRIGDLIERLGHPEDKFPIIHVAGTNGKGSVAAMVTQALMAEGLRVGLNTSPDLGQINERVMINRVPLDPEVWDRLGERIECVGCQMLEAPTFFEAVTGLALLAFSELEVDIAVVEVGLGGRLDATNIVPTPLLSIITPIAFDHMDRLGWTIESIAREKAGILKSGTRLVLATQPYGEAASTVKQRAEDLLVPVTEPDWPVTMTPEGPVLTDPEVGSVMVPLQGSYQADNLATAWTAIRELARLGVISHLDRARQGLSEVRWPGRFEVVQSDPLWVVDGAHNLHGIEAVVKTLRQEPWNSYRWHLLFGVLADKPGEEMLRSLLPWVTSVVLTRVPGERGKEAASLLPLVNRDLNPVAREAPEEAMAVAAERVKGSGDALLVTGSLALLMDLTQKHAITGSRVISTAVAKE